MSQYKLLIDKLDEFIRKYYKNQVLRGLIYSVSLLLLFFVAITILEHFAHFDTLIRTILFYLFIGSNLYILTRLVAIPLFKLNNLGERLSYEKAAEIIGRHFSEVQDKLVNVLQLQEVSQSTGGNDLLEAGIDQKIKELKPVPFASAIDLGENRKHLKYALFPILVIGVILFAAPSMITDSTKRLVEHNVYFEKEVPFKFTIENKKLSAIQQEDFELKVKLTGDAVPDEVFVNVGDNQYRLTKENTVSFNYLFKNIQSSMKFSLEADGFRSKEYELEALPNPVLLNFDISLSYPAYTGKKNEILKNTGDLVIPAGTKVTWDFNTQNTDALRLSFSDTALDLSPAGENSYRYSSKFLHSKSYSVSTANSYLKSKDSVVYAINVIPDLYPAIQVDEQKDSISSKKIYFNGEIKDDYGFARLTFNYRHLSSSDSVPVSTALSSVALPIDKNVNQTRFFHYWDLSNSIVNPGDQIEYYFEVFDNDGVHGSKSSRTEKFIYKAPTLKEISENREKNNSEIKKDLEESIKEAKDMQKDLNALNKKVLEKKQLGWEEKKKLEEILEKQAALEKRVNDIKNENLKNNTQQSEFKKPEESIVQKQEQLQKLFDELMTPEMKEMMKQLQKLMENLDKKQMQEAIEKMQLNNKDVEKELDRTLELFKQLEFEQKLKENIEKITELKKEEEKLSEKSLEKKADSKDLKEKQDELNKKFEELKKGLQDMEKKNSELEKPNKMEKTNEEQNKIDQEMKESSQELEDKKNKKASESQKNAAGEMQKMEDKLAKMQSSMEQESAEEDINALREILENLVKLSFSQEDLMKEVSKTRTENPQYVKLAQTQKNLKDDAKMIEDSLLSLSKRVPQIQSIVNREISAINMNMGKAIETMAERQTAQASSRQQFSMTSVNNLALLLNEILQQMQAQAQKNGPPGSGSCNKPGGKGQKPSMSDLRKIQEQLNEQMKKMQAKQKGQKEGKMPGGNSGMSEELVKMAAQQEAIRQMMQKAAEELKKDGKEGMGNAGKLAKKMEETETDLVNKIISQETIKRQQEILTRLLEDEKAEKERDQEEKRQAEQVKNETFSNPVPYSEYNRMKQKETELLKTVPPSLNQFYKNKVTEYFNNFLQ